MGSVPMSDLVTIIVKAPNQQIADQIIQCHLNWTIKKLKDYLSEVYPSKPKLEEQKLIYSGKLLIDSAVLKDVLRTFEGQENHTVHLVCTSKSQKFAKTPVTSSSTTSLNEPASTTANGNTQHQGPSQPRNAQATYTNAGSVPMNDLQGPFFDQFNANQLNANNVDPRYFWPSATTFTNLNNADMSQQYAYMQQAYAQYISQYMQMIGQPGLSYMPSHMPQFVGTSQRTPVPNNQDRPNPERNGVRENQPAIGAIGNDDDEEGRNNRDWLDWFYVFSRVVVLFSVVYFYSTPLRLLAVSLLLCMFYLHQNMRMQNDQLNLNVNNNNNNNVNNNNNNDNVVNHNNQNDENRPVNQDVEGPPTTAPAQQRTETSSDNSSQPADATNPRTEPVTAPPPVPERPSPITITLLAIRTFFLSLVPDHHGI